MGARVGLGCASLVSKKPRVKEGIPHTTHTHAQTEKREQEKRNNKRQVKIEERFIPILVSLGVYSSPLRDSTHPTRFCPFALFVLHPCHQPKPPTHNDNNNNTTQQPNKQSHTQRAHGSEKRRDRTKARVCGGPSVRWVKAEVGPNKADGDGVRRNVRGGRPKICVWRWSDRLSFSFPPLFRLRRQ